MDWTAQESTFLTITFVGSFLILGIWESRSPARELTQSTERRWLAHGALFAASTALQSWLLRTMPVAVAFAAADNPWGWLNRAWQPAAFRFAAAILLLDLVHYFTHRLFHAVRSA